jgi:hypothetical protein
VTSEQHVYEVHPRKDKPGVDLISDALPFGRLWYSEPNAISNAIGYAKFYNRSQDVAIRVYDEAGNVIETHKHTPLFYAIACSAAGGKRIVAPLGTDKT